MTPILKVLYYKEGSFYWRVTIHNKAKKDTLAGYTRSDGYSTIQYQKKRYYVHRLVWEWFHGPIPTDMVIDHIDGNPANNIINNLRCINHNQNLLNIKPRSTNKSGFLGISWDKNQNKWVASLSYKGRRVFRKYYTDITQAIAELDKEREVRLNVNSKR